MGYDKKFVGRHRKCGAGVHRVKGSKYVCNFCGEIREGEVRPGNEFETCRVCKHMYWMHGNFHITTLHCPYCQNDPKRAKKIRESYDKYQSHMSTPKQHVKVLLAGSEDPMLWVKLATEKYNDIERMTLNEVFKSEVPIKKLSRFFRQYIFALALKEGVDIRNHAAVMKWWRNFPLIDLYVGRSWRDDIFRRRD
uniref:Transposase n=1 Tax=viral metagenome TaxID=1070528 RepID=A0A2V0RA36_9ZZZZ